jgi:hypothetical protein
LAGSFSSSTIPFILASVLRSYLGVLASFFCALAESMLRTATNVVTKISLQKILAKRTKDTMAPPSTETQGAGKDAEAGSEMPAPCVFTSDNRMKPACFAYGTPF